MLAGGTGDKNLAPVAAATDNDVEEMLSRVRSLLVFSVENKGPKFDPHAGVKKSDVMSERWKAIFSKHDQEGTGVLSVDNIRRMVRKGLGISERLVSDQAIGDLFSAIDEDGGGSVEFSEFLEFVQQPSTRGTISDEEVVNSVARGVRLALHRNKIRVTELESNFRNFEESGDVATGELGPNDMVRFFRRVLKLSKHECTDKALRVAFHALDDDGSGTMSLDEFLEFIKFCCLESGQTAKPTRVPGLIGGMRGQLPDRMPSRRPGTLPGSPLTRLPFCLNGRDVHDASRLGSSRAFLGRSESEPSLHTLGMRTSQSLNKYSSSASLPSTREVDDDSSPKCLCLTPTGVGSCMALKSEGEKSAHKSLRTESPQKRFWSGKLPSKTCGGYALLKGGHSLKKVEERLFEAGIDVRGHYHKLGNDRAAV